MSEGERERERERAIVAEIARRYGNVIDLEKQPFVMIEILRHFGREFENGGGGAPQAPPPSTIAGSGPGEDVELGDLMKVVLNIQREVREIKAQLEQTRR
jgi:hypothetical protein